MILVHAKNTSWKRVRATRPTVFGDPLAETYPDPDHSISERRFITVGMSSAGRVLMVAHADREENIRIISVRKTTAREREQYEEKS
ncbi:MAG TPA: BrnT family toxin [Candidatus Acidoferrum sp.]|nr:BrnT family toxin [Candidatus Acidoferrum sp.]